ncbi:MAG: HlyD family efflux transporter periplasmic adaptor subunit [Pseudomonadota bacterium]|nr:MAG: HlyD family efflux transporter periplasmic adaptor subunit [Pseudomonadota bacterium]
MIEINKKRLVIAGVMALATVLAVFAWQYLQEPGLPKGIASGNGRLEATAVNITTKFPGRLAAVNVKEGEDVTAGQVLAQIDVRELEAELHQAQALVQQAQKQRAAAAAVITQRKSEVALAEKNLARSRELYENQNIPIEQLQRSETTVQTAQAARAAAEAELALAEAAIEAAKARVESVRTRVDDSALKTPLAGRVLYRLAEPGEVLPAGGKVFTVLDLTDAYMTIFLPTLQAGRLRINDEARIVLDAIPDYVIPAAVSFVSPEAQFTPKEVETRTEREKLMFRVKVRIDPALLAKHRAIMKTGVPGVAYVRLGTDVAWPEKLQVRLPP